jgi:hypothetical protein
MGILRTWGRDQLTEARLDAFQAGVEQVET